MISTDVMLSQQVLSVHTRAARHLEIAPAEAGTPNRCLLGVRDADAMLFGWWQPPRRATSVVTAEQGPAKAGTHTRGVLGRYVKKPAGVLIAMCVQPGPTSGRCGTLPARSQSLSLQQLAHQVADLAWCEKPILPAAWVFILGVVAMMAFSTRLPASTSLASSLLLPVSRSSMPIAAMAAIGLMTFWPVYFGARAAHGLEHADALGVDVAAGRHAQAALDHRRQVGDDVAEHVVGDDHVVVLGVLDEPHAAGVDVVVVAS